MATSSHSKSILEAYVADRRKMAFAGYQREDLGKFVRQTPLDGKGGGWIYFPSMEAHELDEVIAEQVAYFRNHGLDFEWKAYDFDQPTNVSEKLLQHGFTEGEPEHLMVFDLSSLGNNLVPIPEGIDLLTPGGDFGLEDIRRFQESIWEVDLGRHFDYMAANAEIFSIHLAVKGNAIVGSSWTEYLPKSTFPELHGGAVDPRFRGQGIYSALLKIRLNEAVEKGYQFMTADAAPMSKPILERKGFVSLGISRPYTKAPTD